MAVLIGAAVAWRLFAPGPPAKPAQAEPVTGAAATDPVEATPRLPSLSPTKATDLPNDDPNDLANYFRPGDAEPTGAELISAMHEVGIRTGIGAFNPPGTSPPLEGLAVPEDFELPEGYIRHHQSTDGGVPIEPILMFAPGFVLHDASGNPISMPADRVVPAGLAPPGLPLRRVRIPAP